MSLDSMDTAPPQRRKTVEETTVLGRARRRPSIGVGSRLGSYILVEELGEGGVGVVFLAEHRDLKRKVAIKVLRPEHAVNPIAIKRFFGEAQAVNAIQHRNIVEVTDFGNEGDGRVYYIMELLEGETLRDAMNRSPFSVDRMRATAIQIADALSAAHGKLIIHRDLKPENVFLTKAEDGRDFVKLLDFGVAKLSDSIEVESPHQTMAGALVGTPAYMSPEQTLGAPVDHRADVYALGVLLFEMTTGQRPFPDEELDAVLEAHRTRPPPLVAELRPEEGTKEIRALDALIQVCMAKRPEDRPATMAEVADRLRCLPISSVRPKRPAWRWPAMAAAASMVAGTAFALWPREPPAALTRADPSPAPVVPKEAVSVAEPPLVAPRDKEISIRFESEPSGAKVILGGEEVGRTPVVQTLLADEDALDFQIELDGYEKNSGEVVPSADHNFHISLTKKETPRRRSQPRKKITKRTKKPPKKADALPRPVGAGEIKNPYAQ